MKDICYKIYWIVLSKLKDIKIESINVNRKTQFGKGVTIRKNVLVGKNVTIGDYSYISGPYTVVEETNIGKFSSIALGVKIGLSEHNYSYVSTHPFLYSKKYKFLNEDKKKVSKITSIGNDVWIGAGAIIKKGINIGDGAVIGAGSIVTKDVEPYSIVCGNPAKIIKYRFSKNEINRLKKIKWWEFDKDYIMKNINYFYKINIFLDWNKNEE